MPGGIFQRFRMQNASFTTFVLDDDPAVNEVLCGILGRNGVPFRSFLRLDELLSGMAEGHPDLLFLDVRLADADAVEAIRQLHAIGYQGKIQVVSGLSAPQLSDVYRMLERYGYGALYPITKPFRSAAIKAVLSHAMTPDGPTAAANTAVAPVLVAGWTINSAGAKGVLLLQPHLLDVQDQPDLLAAPALFEKSIQAALDSLRDTAESQIWLHMSVETALTLPLASLSARFSGQSPLQLTIIVPMAQMTSASPQWEDLRTRLSVYGFRLGICTSQVTDLSMELVDRLAGGLLLLSETEMSRIANESTGRTRGESLLSLCRSRNVSVAAAHDINAQSQNNLVAPALEWQVSPIRDMVPMDQLDLLALPHVAFPEKKGADQSVLLDFPGRELLSQREIDIANLTASGLSAKETGRTLGLSHRTVEVHRSNIFAKLSVKNVTQLTRLVLGLR